MTRTVLILSLFASALAQAAPSIPVKMYGCNADALLPVPGSADQFVGRILENGDPNSCSGTNWSLTLLSMDWSNHQLGLVQKIFQTPKKISNGTVIMSAYDPAIALIGNELWVSFECVGPGIIGAAACVGPLTNGAIDPNRTTLVVNGGSADSRDANTYSASHPFIFPYRDHVYLYWTAVQASKSNQNNWGQLTSRGVEIENVNGHFFASGSGNSTIVANDSRTVEVMGVNPADPLSNRVADFFQVINLDDEIYVTAGIGGGNCTTPISGGSGCYRLGISRTTQPLAYHAFNQEFYSGALPDNSQEYTRIVKFPDGHFYLMGAFVGAPVSPNSVAAGFAATLLPEADPFFKDLISRSPPAPPITASCNLDQLNRDGSNIAAVQYVYCTLLQRNVDASGLNTWKSVLDRKALSRIQMAAQIFASAEVTQKYGISTLSNSAFINLVYQLVLHRDADAPGLQNWVNAMNHGLNKSQVFAGIESSAESKQKNPILFK